jgi:hypothetical protein
MLPMLKLMADGLDHPVAFLMERLAKEDCLEGEQS